MAMNRMAIAGEESNGEIRQGFDSAPREVSHAKTITLGRTRVSALSSFCARFI